MKPGDSVKVADLPIASNPDVDLNTSRDAVVVLVTESHNSALPEEDASEEESEEK